jgi:adenylate kinase
MEVIKNLPMRNYLMEFVIPDLNDCLLAVSNMLPDDPVEFLVIYFHLIMK